MTEEERKIVTEDKTRFESQFWKAFLVVLAAFLTFAGPTYIFYVLQSVLDLNYFISMGLGISLFITGLILLWYLIKRKVIS